MVYNGVELTRGRRGRRAVWREGPDMRGWRERLGSAPVALVLVARLAPLPMAAAPEPEYPIRIDPTDDMERGKGQLL